MVSHPIYLVLRSSLRRQSRSIGSCFQARMTLIGRLAVTDLAIQPPFYTQYSYPNLCHGNRERAAGRKTRCKDEKQLVELGHWLHISSTIAISLRCFTMKPRMGTAYRSLCLAYIRFPETQVSVQFPLGGDIDHVVSTRRPRYVSDRWDPASMGTNEAE